jgi:hypothetical protein
MKPLDKECIITSFTTSLLSSIYSADCSSVWLYICLIWPVIFCMNKQEGEDSISHELQREQEDNDRLLEESS